MDCVVYPQPLRMGAGDPKQADRELAEADAELRAAQASKDQVWQARAARRVQRLREQRKERNP